jgi:hypothetical protein
MKQVQFLFLVSVLYLSAGAQQKNISQEYDFTRFFSPAYRNYINKYHERFNNSSAGIHSIITIKHGGNFSSSKYNPVHGTQYYLTPGYGYRKNFALELLQSDFLGKVIQSIIQEKQARQILPR